MKRLEHNIQQEKEKVQKYGEMVINLLNKKEYGKFLNLNINLLHEHLIIYQGLKRVKLDDEAFKPAKKDIEKDTENEKE